MITNFQESESARPVEAPSRLVVELGPMLRLAGPVVLAELGWMSMGIVNTIVVGPLGAEATGAVGLGSNLYMAAVIFGIGLLLGLDTLVSQEHGAGRAQDARRSLAGAVPLGGDQPDPDAPDPGDDPHPAPAGHPG